MGASSESLELEKLLLEYEKILNSYNQASLEYIDFLSGTTDKKKTDCRIIGDTKYNSYCQKEASSASASRCGSNCGTYIKGVGYACCSSGCCGASVYDDYMLLGISDTKKLVKMDATLSQWVDVDDGVKRSDLIALTDNNDGRTVVGVVSSGHLYYKMEYDKPWTIVNNNLCCVTSVAMGMKDTQTVVGVGMNKTLVSVTYPNNVWVDVSTAGESGIIAICIAPNGNIFALNNQNKILKKTSYLNLKTQQWTTLVTANGIAMTVAPDGKFYLVGTDNKLYMQPDYKNLTSTWQLVNADVNGKIIDIATVKKPILPVFVNIKDTEFSGTFLSKTNKESVTECNALCSTNDKCSGATYRPKTKECALSQGANGNSIPSKGNYAIVAKRDYLLKIIETNKNKLDDLNERIQILITQLYDETTEKLEESKDFGDEIHGKYNYLLAERVKTDRMVKYYKSLELLEDEKEIFVTKNYYMYMLLLASTVVGIIVLSTIFIDKSTIGNFNITPSSESMLTINPFYIIFSLILLFIFWNFYKQYYI